MRQDGDVATTPSFDFDRLSEADLRARRTRKWNAFAPDVLPMDLAELDVPTAPAVMDAIRCAVEMECFGYPMFADTTLAETTASWCARRYGWTLDPAWIHDVPDVLRGIELALDELCPPGDVIVPTPAYPPFFEMIAVTGRRTVEVPLVAADERLVLDLDAIGAAFAGGARTMLLCNPQNPTGRAFDEDELTALSVVVDDHGGRVIADEVHAPLVLGGRRHVPYASVSNVAASHAVTLLAASKAWNLAGLKCAQAVMTNPRDAATWRALAPLRTMGASTIGIAASIAAYEHGGEWLDALLVYLEGNRQVLVDRLTEEVAGARVVVPEATYLAWVDFTETKLPCEPFDHFLVNARVALRAGGAFGTGFEQCARINFGTTRAVLQRGIDALAAAVPARDVAGRAGR